MSDMSASELALLALEYEKLARQLAEMGRRIKEAVLAQGKSLSVGNVRVRYTKGRTTYDYETVGQTAPLTVIEACTKQVVDWKKVCELANLAAPIKSVSEPSVSISIEGLED